MKVDLQVSKAQASYVKPYCLVCHVKTYGVFKLIYWRIVAFKKKKIALGFFSDVNYYSTLLSQ